MSYSCTDQRLSPTRQYRNLGFFVSNTSMTHDGAVGASERQHSQSSSSSRSMAGRISLSPERGSQRRVRGDGPGATRRTQPCESRGSSCPPAPARRSCGGSGRRWRTPSAGCWGPARGRTQAPVGCRAAGSFRRRRARWCSPPWLISPPPLSSSLQSKRGSGPSR
jgi:hypothetical protein